jgi:hypothetical protein
MRYFLSLLLLFAMPLFSFGQTSVPDFGVFENDEIQLKECDFDRSAEAIILFDKATTTYDDQYNMITDRRIRFKVLKESGIRRADIHLPYYSEDRFQSIGSVEAIVLTEEGGNLKTFTLDKKSVYDRKLNQLYSEVVFALPNVKVGSIIDYRYKITSESYSALREWYFQSDLPVKLSSYNLYMNPTLAFAYSVRKSALYPITIKQDKDLGRTLFEMKDIPGLRDEAYSTAERDFLQRVDFQLSNFTSRSGAAQTTSTTWPEMNKELLQSSYFGSQLNKDISDPALGLSLAAAKSADDKVKLVHGYVKKTMTWDHIDSKYSDEGIKKAWDKKKGNSGDINLILVNLLKQAGLQAYPLLVSEREHGKIDTTYPYLNQFNKIVALVQAEDRDYILDGSDNATPWFMIPPSLLNTKGFIIDKKRSGFYNINDNKRKYGSYIQFLGKVTEPGKMMVDATVNHNE